MAVVLFCTILWLFAVFGETALFSPLPWFNPNLLFIVSCIFCLRWRGFETLMLAVLLGLTADCFSTIPFGIYGFSFFLIAIFTRWYAIKIYQGAHFITAIIVALLLLLQHLLVFLILSLLFSQGEISFRWLGNLIAYDVVPTFLLSVPCLRLFMYLEFRFKLQLTERRF